MNLKKFQNFDLFFNKILNKLKMEDEQLNQLDEIH